MQSPIALFIYNRPDCVKQALDKLSLVDFYKLYIFSDGPRDSKDLDLCDKCVEVVKSHKIYKEKSCILIKNEKNKGMVNQICYGLDFVFANHESLIYLQDDQEINSSSYSFCNELLDIYKNNNEIGHINLSNFIPKYAHDLETSYFFSYFISVWGFGTWKRVWNSYDPQMKEWKLLNKESFLKKYFTNSKHRHAVKKMYDLHCFNDDPWTWDISGNLIVYIMHQFLLHQQLISVETLALTVKTLLTIKVLTLSITLSKRYLFPSSTLKISL